MIKFFLDKLEEFKQDPSRPEILKKHSLKYTWEANIISYKELFRTILDSRK
jgi:hypothetical protein